MIQVYLQQIQLLLKRLSVAYLLYFVCRVLFFLNNSAYFAGTGVTGLLKNCFYGLRFDTFSIVVSNSLFILLSILPFNFFYKAWYQRLLLWLFMLGNSVFIAANFIDVGYFPFIRKRASSELFRQLGGQSEMSRLLPQFLKDYWFIFLLFILSVVLLYVLYRRMKLLYTGRYTPGGIKQWLAVILIFVLTAGLAVLGARGGLQRIPIDLVNAGSMTEPEQVPILLNTPFTLIKSFDQASLEEHHFFGPAELKKHYDPVHHYRDSAFKKQNVVVLILESFAREYTRLGRMKGVTPFLDSLMGHSLVFGNAFSNGSKSIEGIPAILSGLPSLMENPFINSIYANNAQTTFASLLGEEGYETAFFHGGINGTMNFDDWSALAGYAAYYGMNEYGNKKDFDGYWGIWDEPFLQYTVKKMSGFKQPFHSAIFTLSSHHPYFIPEQYKGKFPEGELENTQSIGYADHALRLFFASAQRTAWYNNTLFILTADHGSLSEHPFYSNVVGNQGIPILFFKPDHSLAGRHDKVFSQIDILPSAMQLLGYSKPFFAFGESFAGNKPRNSYFYANSTQHLFGDSMLFRFTPLTLTSAFNYRRDSTLGHNIVNQYPAIDSLSSLQFKAFIQTYNHTLIENSGRVKNGFPR